MNFRILKLDFAQFRHALAKLALAPIAALAAAFLLPGCATEPIQRNAVIAAEPAPQSGPVMIAPHVYVEHAISPEDTRHLLNLMGKARVRAAHFYGELVAEPDILFCVTQQCYRRYGGVGLGYTIGNRILISPRGARAAIITHELSHVELSARLDGRRDILDSIPQWFDEGTAVMVSLAHEFSDEAWASASRDGVEAPPLNALESVTGWNEATGINGVHMQRSYGTARQEVLRWYEKVGSKGLLQLIQALKNRENFFDAYQNIERSASPVTTAAL